MERDTIRRIRQATQQGKLQEPFRARDVHEAAGIRLSTAQTFLSKHRVRNPSGRSELFVQTAYGLYRLKDEQNAACQSTLRSTSCRLP